MNYSYLMGISNIEELRELGFIIHEIEGDYGIIFPKNKQAEYESFIKRWLTPGYWNEYLGDEYVFIFKFEDGHTKKYIYNEVNSEEILRLCCQFAECSFSSVMQMLKDNEFYATNYFK